MIDARQFYIDGQWTPPTDLRGHQAVINPATEEAFATIALGGPGDVDLAVKAARQAFETYGVTTPAERRELLLRVIAVYERRYDEMAQIISREVGAPIGIAKGSHAAQGLSHLKQAAALLQEFAFEQPRASGRVVHEPIGVCALITPWNWPISLIACKVAPALAAGCTVVLKPSEAAPLNAHLFAEILHEAGAPPGVFNLVDGEGPVVGDALARHPGIDMISITGSNRAGVAVAEAAAATVKRVTQELGGKSACILLPGVDVTAAARDIAGRVFRNSGQSCAALTRLLAPKTQMAEAEEGARASAEAVLVGDPANPATMMGPLINAAQFERVQGFLTRGAAEGAKVVAGGVGRPEGASKGYFVRPTVFSNVRQDMEIAQEEIFGPVLCIIPYADEDEAVAIANGVRYGLSGAVRSADPAEGLRVARRLRTGMVHVNETTPDYGAPFGGYKQSGNGREWGAFGLTEYLETKMIYGV